MMKHRQTALPIVLFVLLPLLGAAQQQQSTSEYFSLNHEQTEDGGYRFLASNSHIIPLYLVLEVERMEGLISNQALPVRILLPAGSQNKEVLLLRRGSGNRVSFSTSAMHTRGDPTSVSHDDGYLYLLPYPHGRKYRLTQGYDGSFTHSGQNQYALDFDLETGDPVHAAREGLVVEVKEDSRIGGPSARYNEHANYILILHDDGSFGNYVHLVHRGSLVQQGDQVEAGQHIGYSGNTGQSSGPHLHFDVRIPTHDGSMQSIPIWFLGHDRKAIELEEGRYYYSHHPENPEFEIILGSELKNVDFSEYRTEIDRGGLDIRVETIDSTYILFLQNGTESRLQVDVRLQLQGMEASTPLDISRAIDPRTEIFLSILRPLPAARTFRYGYSIRYQEL